MKAIDYINKKEFEINGIINWHKQGYTGKGVKIATIEKCNTDVWYLKKTVNDPFSNAKESLDNSHGNQTLNVISQVAPDADFYTLPRGGVYKKDSITGSLVEKSLPFMISEGIHLINASLGGTNNELLNEVILNVQEHGTTFICSAGNSGDRGTSPYAKSGVWIAVGAVVLTDKEKIKLTSYSSIGDAVDFVQFSEIYVNDVRGEHNSIYCSGTSFSSPLLTGMLALVQQFFKETTGQYLKQNELYQFMIDNSTDLGDEGKDTKYGHGLFILPDPDDIDVSKYTSAKLPVEGEESIEGFTDVKGHWGEKYIMALTEKGILDGYGDGTFKPDNFPTRAELAKVLYYYDKQKE